MMMTFAQLAFFLAVSAQFGDAWKLCKKRSFDQNSFVCVCSANYCDSAPSPTSINFSSNLAFFVSDRTRHRLAQFQVKPDDQSTQNRPKGRFSALSPASLEVRVNASSPRQRIFGFGGAFTDAAGINLRTLSAGAQRALLQAYFDKEIGIGYSLGRVPIGSTDFSTREYSYLDTPNDFNLTTFGLAKEDLEDKIPFILAAIQMTGGNLSLFASPWSAPGWMKDSGRMKGAGQLKGPFNGQFYRTYAHYFKKFFEAYAQHNVTFWGMTIENEPGAGAVPSYQWQAMYLSPKMQRDFASYLLSPLLKQSPVTKHLKIMAHDDQRSMIWPAAQEIYATPAGANAIDGLGVHWYSHSAFDVLSKTHNLRPDKFILATEACTGCAPDEHKVLFGDWSRAKEYAHDILNNLRNWAIGWTDWNLCLDLQGGPNWVGNFVDAPIIVNASSDEFYKQPMFYAMAHFSRFVPRDSIVISSSLFADGTEMPDRPVEPPEVRFRLNLNKPLSDNPVEHVAFQTPNGLRVLVLLNSDRDRSLNITIVDHSDDRRWTLPVGPDSMVTALWRPKNG